MILFLVQNGEDELRDRQEKYHGLRVSISNNQFLNAKTK